MTKGYIYSKQNTLFGQADVVGFGDFEFCVSEIDRGLANEIIKKNHYSNKFVNTSTVHLGVFIRDDLVGVLQYGVAMNPASGGSVVKGTSINEYLELNRMWLDDVAPRNSESKAISYSIKYIKRKLPLVGWIQSFADERCGGFGIVYQACSFSYYGEHSSIFWEIDGIAYHNSLMTNGARPKRKKWMEENKHRATKHTLRQFRYIKFIDRRLKSKCLLKEREYPKHYDCNP